MTSLQHSSHSWLYLQKKRRPCINYMEVVQQDVNTSMRATLVDWLVEFSQKYKLVPETLFLAVNYIDRFLSQRAVPRRKLQLVGITCLLIAAKYEEMYAPTTDKICNFTDNTYTREETLAMEQKVHPHVTIAQNAHYVPASMLLAKAAVRGVKLQMFLSCAVCCNV